MRESSSDTGSDACRKRKIGSVDRDLEVAILSLLDGRPRGGSIGPSGAARAAVDATLDADPSSAKGPIRIRRYG